MLSAELRAAITNNEISKIMNHAEKLDNFEKKECIKSLLELLESTDSGTERNTIALVLSDLRCNDAVPILIELIKKKKTRNNRGTLLYALQPLEYREHLDVIVVNLVHGNFECSRMAYNLIASVIDDVDDKKRKEIHSQN